MMAVQEAAANIRCGMADAVVAGGIDSMTRSPMLFETSPFPFGGVKQLGRPATPTRLTRPTRTCSSRWVRTRPRECGITREESDDWSYHSHIRAVAATEDGRFAEEIVPVTVPAGRGETVTVTWTSTRGPTPPREAGGAAIAHRARRSGDRRELVGHCRRRRRPVLVSRAYAEAHGMTPLATVRSWNSPGSSRPAPGWPRRSASPGRCRAGLSESDVDLVEINEAFATMAVACRASWASPTTS